MYKLMQYCLRVLTGLAVVFGFIGWLPYSGLSFIYSFLAITVACWFFNIVFSKIFKVPTNAESYAITGLILFFILAPIVHFSDLWIDIVASFLAMASKFFFTYKRNVIFNPAAISVFILGLFGIISVTWWVATPIMIPFVLIAGYLILKKLNRFSMFFAFLISSIGSIFAISVMHNLTIPFPAVFYSWPLIFFGVIMLTEPQTTPPKLNLQIIYGILVGILCGVEFHFGPLYSTPEFALIAGNIFSFLVRPKVKIRLKLKEKNKLSPDISDFVFESENKFSFDAGQYMDWTLPDQKSDSRGNRRYFTVASSPTENEVHIGVRFSPNGSSFKNHLSSLNIGDEIVAGGLNGNFNLPKDKNKKLAFIAGGIGVTPFRSMIKYMLDKNEKRDAALFYSVKAEQDLVYKDVFDEAQKYLGLKTVYQVGVITEDMIKKEVPDYKERQFYISGPHVMVTAFEDILKKLGVKNIKTDFFPGYV